MRNGALYKLLFEKLLNGFAHCEIVYKDGKAVDWRYLLVNPAFMEQTGLRDVVGKLASEAIPGIHAADPELLGIYTHVAETMKPAHFERYVEALDDWYDVEVFSHKRGFFTAVFDVVTDRKKIEQTLKEKHTALLETYDETIRGWSRALELRNRETKGHSDRVVDLTIQLAKRLGVKEDELVHYRRGALLHDIGKMGIPDSILLKPGELDENERAAMCLHPELAYMLLKPIKFLADAIHIPRFHHERWDGSGYPLGLKGSEIPLPARIFAVVDVFDALTSNRPYKISLSPRMTLEHIQSEAGRHFDPHIVDGFVEMMEDLK